MLWNEPEKSRLYMAKVDVIANNTSSILDIFKDCPYFLNGLIVSGKHNLCLFFVGEDIAHSSNSWRPSAEQSLVRGAEVSIVITTMKDLVMPIKMNFDFSDRPPLVTDATARIALITYRTGAWVSVTNSYNGKIWKWQVWDSDCIWLAFDCSN